MRTDLSSPQKFLMVSLGPLHLGLAIKDIEQLVHLPELIRPPQLGSCLEGFLNLRGKAIPALRLDKLLAQTDLGVGLYTPVVITNNDLALIVERVRNMVSVEEDELLELEAGHMLRNWGSLQFLHEGESVFLLDVERLLLERESTWIEQQRELLEGVELEA